MAGLGQCAGKSLACNSTAAAVLDGLFDMFFSSMSEFAVAHDFNGFHSICGERLACKRFFSNDLSQIVLR